MPDFHHGLLADADLGTPNVIPSFLALPGKVGSFRDGKVGGYYYDSPLARSWCTPDANRHFEATLRHFQGKYGEGNQTPEALRASIDNAMKRDGKADIADYCWLDTSVDGDLNSIVKYEPTFRGRIEAFLRYWALIGAWFFGVSIALLNIYYRGLVYIIVGPRRHTYESSGV